MALLSQTELQLRGSDVWPESSSGKFCEEVCGARGMIEDISSTRCDSD